MRSRQNRFMWAYDTHKQTIYVKDGKFCGLVIVFISVLYRTEIYLAQYFLEMIWNKRILLWAYERSKSDFNYKPWRSRKPDILSSVLTTIILVTFRMRLLFWKLLYRVFIYLIILRNIYIYIYIYTYLGVILEFANLSSSRKRRAKFPL